MAAWTGCRMIVWGGRGNDGLLNDGASYNPADDTWAPLPSQSAPEARHDASVVVATDRVLIWGGEGASGALNTGARLLLDGSGIPQSWQAMNTTGAPSPRSSHAAVQAAGYMVVWGGESAGAPLGDGAAYNPSQDTWTALSATNDTPAARSGHSMVWTGSEVVIWGGEDATDALASGGALDPYTDAWRALSNGGVPTPRSGASAVWTGAELLVFGGLSNGAPVARLERVDPQPTWYFYRKP